MAQKLKLAVKPTFSAPVVMRLPGDDGQVEEVKFNAVFRRLASTESKDLSARLLDKEKPMTDAEVLDLVLVGWDGLIDEAGIPFHYNRENRVAAAEDWSKFEYSISEAYFKYSTPAAEKN